MLLKNEFKTFDRIFSLFICFIYSISVIFVNSSFFRDRDVYESVYVLHSSDILNSYNGIQVYTNEPLFLYLNIFLSNFFPPNFIIYSFVAIIVLSCVFFIYNYSRNSLILTFCLLILFFSPFLFHFQFVVLRQSLATVIFLFSFLYIDRKNIKFFLIAITPFVHSLFFLIVFLYFVFYFLKDKMTLNKLISLFFIICFVFNILFFSMGKFLGLRQIEETHVVDGVAVGGGAFVFIFFIFLYFLYFYEGVKDNLYIFSLILLIFFLSTYFFLPISGRLMSSVLLMVLLVLARENTFKSLGILFFISLISLFTAFSGYIENGSLNVPFNSVLNYIINFKWLF